MKSLILLSAICLASSNAVNLVHRKKMKIFNEVIDFDEEEQFKEEKAHVQITYDQLAKEDNVYLQGFDQLIKSADRNAGLGSMNVEMAKA